MSQLDYLEFFGLTDYPFRLTPDIKYFYPSYTHRSVLHILTYALKRGDGFLVVIGEPGVGKTMLLRYLLNNLDSRYQTAFLLTPSLCPLELLQFLLNDLSINYNNSSKETMIRSFVDYLFSLSFNGKQLLLIIDEAQNLPEDTLEELRLLSNLETEDRKLLQIILSGQPHLKDKLFSLNLTQFVQRITVWEELQPLSIDEIKEYIYFRFSIAGNSDIYINNSSFKLIKSFTSGLPRLINKLMDRILLFAASEGVKQISPSLVCSAFETLTPKTFNLFDKLRFFFCQIWPISV